MFIKDFMGFCDTVTIVKDKKAGKIKKENSLKKNAVKNEFFILRRIFRIFKQCPQLCFYESVHIVY